MFGFCDCPLRGLNLWAKDSQQSYEYDRDTWRERRKENRSHLSSRTICLFSILRSSPSSTSFSLSVSLLFLGAEKLICEPRLLPSLAAMESFHPPTISWAINLLKWQQNPSLSQLCFDNWLLLLNLTIFSSTHAVTVADFSMTGWFSVIAYFLYPSIRWWKLKSFPLLGLLCIVLY